VKKLLLILASVVCASPAFANVTATSGYWFTSANDNSCGVLTRFPDGRGLGVGVVRNSGLYALVQKPSWYVPDRVRVAASIQVDGYPPLSGPGMAVPEWPNTIAIPVQPRFYGALIHQVFVGWWATVRFTGNEPPWRVSLWGVKDSWPAFMQCAQRVSPVFVNQLYGPTQPY
jgi:hypothetical protein